MISYQSVSKFDYQRSTTYLRLDLTGSCEGSVNFTHDDCLVSCCHHVEGDYEGGCTYMLDGEEDRVDGEKREIGHSGLSLGWLAGARYGGGWIQG